MSLSEGAKDSTSGKPDISSRPSTLSDNSKVETTIANDVIECSSDDEKAKPVKRGLRFWMCIVSLMTTSLLVALDQVRYSFVFVRHT